MPGYTLEPIEEEYTLEPIEEPVKKPVDEGYSLLPGEMQGIDEPTLREAKGALTSGAVSWIPAGLSMFSFDKRSLPERAKTAQDIQEELTYQPKTKESSEIVGDVVYPLTWMKEKGDESGAIYDQWADEAEAKGDLKTAKAYRILAGISRFGGEAAPFGVPYLVSKGYRGMKGAVRRIGEDIRSMESMVGEESVIPSRPELTEKIEAKKTSVEPPIELDNAVLEPITEPVKVESPAPETAQPGAITEGKLNTLFPEGKDLLTLSRAFKIAKEKGLVKTPEEFKALLTEEAKANLIDGGMGTSSRFPKEQKLGNYDVGITGYIKKIQPRATSGGKQPWEMTRGEWIRQTAIDETQARLIEQDKVSGSTMIKAKHEVAVLDALAEGKPVPPSVLKDYPDLKAEGKGVAEKWVAVNYKGTLIDVIPEAVKVGEKRYGGQTIWRIPESKVALARNVKASVNSEATKTLKINEPKSEFGKLPEESVTKTGEMFGKEGLISPEILESLIKGGRIGDLPKYAEGSSINLERMNTTQDVLQFQNGLTQIAEKEIGKRKVSWDETTKAAEDLSWDEKDFLRESKKKGGFSAAEIHAMRQINATSLHDLFRTIRDIPADTSLRTEAMRSSVLDKINNYIEIMKSTSQKSSEAGRALNIHKKMIEDNPEFMQDAHKRKVLKQMNDALGGKGMTDEMINDLKNIDFSNPKQVKDVLQKYHKATFWDKIYEIWLNAILSAPTSHAANILGNTLTLMTKVPESIVSKLFEGKSPLGEVRAETIGLLQGMKDGVRATIKAFETGMPNDMMGKVEHQRYHSIQGITGEFIRIPTRALTAADEFFKAIVYRSELNKQAYNIASKEKLQGKELGKRMAEIIADPVKYKDIYNKAHDESLYRTFNQPLGELGSTVMKLRDKVPGLKYVIPFIRTPVNIAKFTFERTPFNYGKILYDYKKGKTSAENLSQELAKPVVGSLISAVATIYALEGNITGAPPKNKKDRDLLYVSGWQPYSVKIGNTYYSYNRLEPIGSIMGMTADFVNAAHDDSEINEQAGKIMLSVSRNLASKTFLSGVSNMLDAISDPERYGSNFVEKMTGSLIPSIMASAARAYDPYIRDVQTPWETIQSRIPGMSENVPYKTGAYDLPVERPGTFMTKFISPVSISEERPGLKQIADIDRITHEVESKQERIEKKMLRESIRNSRKTNKIFDKFSGD